MKTIRRNIKSLLGNPTSVYRLLGLVAVWQTLGLLLGIGFVFIFTAVLYIIFLFVDYWEWDWLYTTLYKFVYREEPPPVFKKRRWSAINMVVSIFYSALALIPISLGYLLIRDFGFFQQNLIYLATHQ
jgi:hypothetical protein